MRVAFDISLFGAMANAHQRHVFGVSRVALETAQALLRSSSEVEELFFLARQCIASSQRYFEANFVPIGVVAGRAPYFIPPAQPEPVLSVMLWLDQYFSANYVHVPWKYFGVGRAAWWAIRKFLDRIDPAIESRIEIYHSVFGGFAPWTIRSSKLIRLQTVYDLIPLIQPQHFHGSTVAAARRALAELNHQDWALCISESTRHDLLEHFPRVDPAKALVVPLAADARFSPERDPEKIRAVRFRHKIPEGPYFLSLCTVEPRKNVDVIIRGFTRFCEQESLGREVSLVLVGKIIEHPPRFRAALEAAGALRERIVFTGFVEDDHLPALYSGASSFVYMSNYEGFGLPVLEAMQCGVPVIASKTSSIPEVVGEAGILLEPNDVEGLSEKLALLLRDKACGQALSLAGLNRARRFSWKTFGERTLAAYQAALKE